MLSRSVHGQESSQTQAARLARLHGGCDWRAAPALQRSEACCSRAPAPASASCRGRRGSALSRDVVLSTEPVELLALKRSSGQSSPRGHPDRASHRSHSVARPNRPSTACTRLYFLLRQEFKRCHEQRCSPKHQTLTRIAFPVAGTGDFVGPKHSITLHACKANVHLGSPCLLSLSTTCLSLMLSGSSTIKVVT